MGQWAVLLTQYEERICFAQGKRRLSCISVCLQCSSTSLTALNICGTKSEVMAINKTDRRGIQS